MPLLRPTTTSRALRTSRCLLQTNHTHNTASSSAIITILPSRVAPSFSTTARITAAEHAHHEESQYDPPSGWLWGIKPGEKYQKEGWETIWVWGFFGSLGLGVVAYAFKPDTSIQTWALEEARRRLEAEGILKEPESKS